MSDEEARKRVEEYVAIRRETWGEKYFNESGFEFLAKEVPEWFEQYFMHDAATDLGMNQWPKKYWELVIFAVCVAIGAKVGTVAHARNALLNGATKRDLLDCMFFAGHARSHSVVLDMMHDLKPILEE